MFHCTTKMPNSIGLCTFFHVAFCFDILAMMYKSCFCGFILKKKAKNQKYQIQNQYRSIFPSPDDAMAQ